jgi:hypothetical protein
MFDDAEEQKPRTGGEREFTWTHVPLPLKFCLVFAAVSYGVQMYLTYAPSSSHPMPGSRQFRFGVDNRSPCIFMPTVDPRPSTMAHVTGAFDLTCMA